MMLKNKNHRQKSFYPFFPTEYFKDVFNSEAQIEKIQKMELEIRAIEDIQSLKEEYLNGFKRNKKPVQCKSEIVIAREILKRAKENSKLANDTRISHYTVYYTYLSLLIAIISLGLKYLEAINVITNTRSVTIIWVVMIVFYIYSSMKTYLSMHELKEIWLEEEERYNKINICFDVFESAVDQVIEQK